MTPLKSSDRKRFLLILPCVVSLSLLCASCIFFKKNVKMQIEADEALNNNRTMVLIIFQLQNKKDFDEDWRNYLDGTYDSSKVLGDPVKETIKPGQTLELTLQKEKNAKFIGIVAGYYKPHQPLRVKKIADLKEGSRITLILGSDGIVKLKQ